MTILFDDSSALILEFNFLHSGFGLFSEGDLTPLIIILFPKDIFLIFYNEIKEREREREYSLSDKNYKNFI